MRVSMILLQHSEGALQAVVVFNVVVVRFLVNFEGLVDDVDGARDDTRDSQAEMREPADGFGNVGAFWSGCDW